jgi:hypothetical protein
MEKRIANMNYFTFITPLVAGVIAVYGIFPDVFVRGTPARRRAFAAFLIVLGVVTSIWSAYTAYSDEKYLSSWRAVENIHDGVGKAWRDFQRTILDTERLPRGTAKLKEAEELIKQGRFKEAEVKTSEALQIMNNSQPDPQKLAKVSDDIHQLMIVADRSGVSYDLKYRTVLFCVTLETVARRHSTNRDLQPFELFAAIMKDEASRQHDKMVFSPGWSELLWSIGYFRPSDFGAPLHMLSVDDTGRLIIDENKFDEDFLISRASFLMDWFQSASR